MTLPVQMLDPTEFLQPNRRLFIDTNIFMDTDARRAGGLKRLFERGQDAIAEHNNPIIVPTKVVGELAKQSRLDPARETDERAEAIKKAASALTFLASASQVGLVRKDLGDDTNPYADDLFLRIFEQFAGTYEMCLLTHDITIKIRIRLLAHKLSKRLLVGVLTKDGDLEVDSDQALFERGLRKHARHAARVQEGTGTFKDESEVAALRPLLDDFQKAFGLIESAGKIGGRRVIRDTPAPKPSPAGTAAPFSANAKIKPSDTALTFTSLPREGDQVRWESASESGTFALGALLGEGGEGAVYDGGNNRVVKVFDKDHITQHRMSKVELLVRSGLQAKGLCLPTAVVRNGAGEFVGYVMPKASGREARTIFNIRKLEKDFPDWKKSDLVDICISFLELVELLHAMNVVLGDINPKNLMIDDRRNVFIIDADSWQLNGYPCPVGTPMYTSPRMLGKTYADDLRTMQDELFAVATMLFQIVMTGQFPYMRTGTDGDMVQLIREGNFAFQYENRNNKDQPDGDWKYIWSHIHKPVKDLFWHTFHNEGRRYKKRPTATEWLTAFRAYKAYLANDQLNFDPMSNDVRPIRPKAFRPDTPIQDCPNCGRKHAIAGIWNDEDAEYFVPRQCTRCRDAAPQRPAPARVPQSASASPSRSLTSPKTRVSELAKRHGITSKEALEKLSAVGEFAKTASSSISPEAVKKFEAAYAGELQRRGTSSSPKNILDPARLCARCQKPFITYGNVEWHQRAGKTVPTTHKAGPGGTYPAGCAPAPARSRTTNIPSHNAGPQQPKKKGFWARLFGS